MGDALTMPGRAPAGRPAARGWLVALTALAVVAARLPVLLTHLDTWLPFEIQSGTIATALLDGLHLDHARLPIIEHIRGSALFGYLLVPIYALLGPTAFAMKLLPLLWHALTAGMLVAVLDRFARRRVAVAAGLLIAMAPPLLAKVSVLGLASHLESSLFWIAALGCALSMTARERCGPGRCLALGALVGLAGFFHLQALLGCLLVLALFAVLAGRRVGPTGWLALAAGIALAAAPSWLFEGGSLHFLRQQTAVLAGAPDAATRLLVEAATPGGDVQGPPTLRRFVEALDFGAGQTVLAMAYAALLLAAGLIAIVGEAADLGRWWRGRRAGPAAPPGGTLFFVLHPLIVLGAFIALGMAIEAPGISAGVENRRLAGVLFSLVVLAAVGVGRAAGPRLRRVQRALLAGLVLLGAGGLAATSRRPAPPAQRGECYEWFMPQLAHHAGGDPEALLATLARIDRGDHRFAALRFAVDWPALADADAATLAAERAAWSAAPDARALFRAAAVGRALVAVPTRLLSVDVRKALAEVDGPERAALWHGVGIGLPSSRPGLDVGQYRTRLAAVAGLCASLRPADAQLVAEGFGFARGFAIDPYGEALVRQLADFDGFEASLRAAVYRGAGWGYRQRWLDPPTDRPPEGLVVLTAVPAHAREDFLDGLLARRLPAEAERPLPGR